MVDSRLEDNADDESSSDFLKLYPPFPFSQIHLHELYQQIALHKQMIFPNTLGFFLFSISCCSAKLGGGTKARKLQINPVEECYTNTQSYSVHAYASDPTYLLTECEGDCDDDSDCYGDMICFQRDASGYVPSCGGGLFDSSSTDYCIHPGAVSEVQFCGSNPSHKLTHCQGDCDEDTDW